MKQRALWLGLLMLLSSSVYADFLSGCWRNVRNNYGRCYIQQQGNRLVLTNENGTISEGQLYGNGYIVAFEWNNTQGQVVGNDTILWQGNGEWQRDYTCGR